MDDFTVIVHGIAHRDTAHPQRSCRFRPIVSAYLPFALQAMFAFFMLQVDKQADSRPRGKWPHKFYIGQSARHIVHVHATVYLKKMSKYITFVKKETLSRLPGHPGDTIYPSVSYVTFIIFQTNLTLHCAILCLHNDDTK